MFRKINETAGMGNEITKDDRIQDKVIYKKPEVTVINDKTIEN